MKIYSFQPKDVLNVAFNKGIALVDFSKTNLLNKLQQGVDLSHAYIWMAGKLSEKTGIWFHNVYGQPDPLYRKHFGDLMFEDNSMPILPFWGWYLVDDKNERPGMDYCFDSGSEESMFDWNHNKNTVLIELDIPDQFVLLSDANAWYCVLQGLPCYQYESEEEEACLLARFEENVEKVKGLQNDADVANAIYILYREVEHTWNNIFRLEGRRLRELYPFGVEKRDVQAVFPYIDKKWIMNVWECN